MYPIRRSNLGYLRQHAVARMHLFTKLTSDGPLQDDMIVKQNKKHDGRGGVHFIPMI